MNVITEVKQRLDIVEVVSHYLPLQPAGKGFRALCPFHTERTPSFYVFPERQSWHCFGSCQTGGDVFSFVMKRENLSFNEALTLLAQRAGVALTTPERGEDEGKRGLYQVNETAAQYYHNLLLHSPAAELARRYLQKRELSPGSVNQFQLGFSLPSGPGLRQHLLAQGYSVELLLASGLVGEREGQEFFRHRLMFPIRDPQRRVVGLGGRALDDSLPKYLNSPASSIFDKGSLLYGLDRAKEAIRKENRGVLVEGYIDVIMAHQHGFTNVVGTLGVALGEKQFLSLKRFTKTLVLALDADVAGLQATLRGLEVAERALEHQTIPVPDWRGYVRYESVLDGELKVLALPPGKDPDEVIVGNPQEWTKLVSQAIPIIEYLLDKLTQEADLSQVGEKVRLVQQLKPLFDEVKEPVKRAHYIQHLARHLGVEERVLVSAMRTPARRGQPAEAVRLPSSQPLEEYCLALLLQHPELKQPSPQPLAEYFRQSQNRELFLAWRDCPTPSALRGKLEPPLQDYLDTLIQRSLPPPPPRGRQQELAHCLRRLREDFLRWQLRAREEALTSQGGGGWEQLEGLEEPRNQLRQVLREK